MLRREERSETFAKRDRKSNILSDFNSACLGGDGLLKKERKGNLLKWSHMYLLTLLDVEVPPDHRLATGPMCTRNGRAETKMYICVLCTACRETTKSGQEKLFMTTFQRVYTTFSPCQIIQEEFVDEKLFDHTKAANNIVVCHFSK